MLVKKHMLMTERLAGSLHHAAQHHVNKSMFRRASLNSLVKPVLSSPAIQK